jgi:hypothetical protein
MRLFEWMPFAEAEKVLVEPLSFWLQDSPEFDPEGWAVPLLRKFDLSFDSQIVASVREIKALVAKRKIRDAVFAHG